MLQVVKDYATWGEINKETLSKLINTRGRLVGDKKITEEYLKSSTSYNSFDELSQAIIDNKIRYKDLPDVKPIFRLSPPRKGYGSIKKPYTQGGAAGYRGEDINNLIERML
jgi:large subunit ribosomal protein L30